MVVSHDELGRPFVVVLATTNCRTGKLDITYDLYLYGLFVNLGCCDRKSRAWDIFVSDVGNVHLPQIGSFFMQLMDEEGHVGEDRLLLPKDIIFCRRLRFLDLSLCSFSKLPSEWKAIRTLECVDLSYNQQLEEVPAWLGQNNEGLWSLSLLGCSRVLQIPYTVINRLSKSPVVAHFNERYEKLSELIRGIMEDAVDVRPYYIPPTARLEWKFSKFFRHFMSNTVDTRTRRWNEVLKVSARTHLAVQIEQMFTEWWKLNKQRREQQKCKVLVGLKREREWEHESCDGLCRLHHAGYVVLEDGFDVGEPSVAWYVNYWYYPVINLIDPLCMSCSTVWQTCCDMKGEPNWYII